LHSCWLTYKDHFIWTFIAPVIVIMIVSVHYWSITIENLNFQINIGFLLMTLNIMRKQEFKTTMRERYGIKRVWYKHLTHVITKLYSMCRYWFRGSVSLIVMMGINWIFGVLLFHESLLPLVYVFSVTTALQVSVIIKLA